MQSVSIQSSSIAGVSSAAISMENNIAAFARAQLDKIITQGESKAASAILQVFSHAPKDSLVREQGMRFAVQGRAVSLRSGKSEWRLHPNALDQVSSRIGVPITYVRALLEPRKDKEDHWQGPLLEHVLGKHAQYTEGRCLIRSVGSVARAVLSDRYRRLDSRPLLEAFVESAAKLGAEPIEGLTSDLSASVRAIVPEVFEPVPGEALVFGLEWSNSDYGTRAYSISSFVLRLVCLNGMVGTNRLKRVHLGGRLPDNLEFSQRTYALDTKTMVSATKDIVASSLSVASIEQQLALVRNAHSTETDWHAAWRSVSRELTKLEQKAVKDSFEGPDVLHLPSGKTRWRLSNALSWLANTIEDPERKVDLQRLAGAAISEAA